MNRRTIQGPKGLINNYEVLTTASIVKDERDGTCLIEKVPAILSIVQYEARPDEPILSIGMEDKNIILEFNSDFPLLFEEGIKLWK